jgi:16S rRNA (guanine527-N7)-methyltransferase
MDETLAQLLSEFAGSAELRALERYFELLVDWNQSVNLTAIVQRDEVYVKHFWDSLAIMNLPLFRGPPAIGSIIDVGTGAGLPGVPLAICNSAIEVTLCDALRKRTDFLQAVVDELELTNVVVHHVRSEEFARLTTERNAYDLVVARAVANLSVLTELLVPFSRPGGHVVCYKGPEVKEEVDAAQGALKLLGATVEAVEELELPHGYGRRSWVVLNVHERTKKRFPRKPGTPQRQPLQ